MIGPAGFMQAPNTHAMRSQPREPREPWEEIKLGQVWASAGTKGFAKIEELPHGPLDGVGLRQSNNRLTHKRADHFLKQYELVQDVGDLKP